MKFNFTYSLDGSGWADSTWYCAGDTVEISSISYLSDAFLSLSEAVDDLLNGRQESSCEFDHEPGRTKIRFILNDKLVIIEIFDIGDTYKEIPYEQAKLLFKCETTLLRLKSKFLEAADLIHDKFDEKSYQKEWGYPFPFELYNKIKSENHA